MDAVLVATLGSEPQVVTVATHLLCSHATPPTRVRVLHTQSNGPPIAPALAQLQAAFAARPSAPPLQCSALPCADVLQPAELECFSNGLYALLHEEIRAGRIIHLLLAGGRKSMTMLGMATAQLLLSENDHVWYLHSDDALRKSGNLWPAPGDNAALIEVPCAPAQPAPYYTRSFTGENPAAARAARSQAQQAKMRNFVEVELTASEREVAALVAREILTTRQLAERLHKAPKTITNQLTLVYSKLESTFGLLPDAGVKREFLRRELAAYFAEP